MSQSSLDNAFVREIVDRAASRHEENPNVLEILQDVQEQLRWLPESALRRTAEIAGASYAEVCAIATFYSRFRLKPTGRHVVSVCHGTACHVKGSRFVEDAIRRHLRIPPDQDTDADQMFTVERVACLGCCTLAPVVRIDGVTFGHLKPETAAKALQDYLRHPPRERSSVSESAPSDVTELRISVDSCCAAGGAEEVHQALLAAERNLRARVHINTVACSGLCHQIPLVEAVQPNGQRRIYSRVGPSEAESIVLRHAKPSGLIGGLRKGIALLVDRTLEPDSPSPWARLETPPTEPNICRFLGPQLRIATEGSGQIDPNSIDEYVAAGGFQALAKALRLPPEEIIDEVERSGLRGRGGAGFPTGRKWRAVREAHGTQKHLIINGDEGDPGAFMDRMLLESFSYRVLEGAVIAALAVGAERGVLYVRAEYPHALRRAAAAIASMRERGYLGADLLRSGRRFDLRIVRGAGAFVCGEETALIAAVEGKRGIPSLRPPYPAQQGLYGQPTCVNNVETFSLVPWILNHGAEAFAAIGTATSKGTKVFALAGNVRRGGLIEVPMGVTIRQVVEDIGGGVPDGRSLKAVQIGGPSGGCVPAWLVDTPLDYEALRSLGCIMGSGGLVVLDDSNCMVDVSRYFLRFTQRESCGQCTSCRIGTLRMLEVLDRLCTGKAKPDDLDRLEALAEHVSAGSLCGLGATAPTPVLTSLRYFREEYEAHLKGLCPAGRCADLVRYEVCRGCIGCTICAQVCPVGAIKPSPHQRHLIDDSQCVRCDACRSACPERAIWTVSGRQSS